MQEALYLKALALDRQFTKIVFCYVPCPIDFEAKSSVGRPVCREMLKIMILE